MSPTTIATNCVIASLLSSGNKEGWKIRSAFTIGTAMTLEFQLPYPLISTDEGPDYGKEYDRVIVSIQVEEKE